MYYVNCKHGFLQLLPGSEAPTFTHNVRRATSFPLWTDAEIAAKTLLPIQYYAIMSYRRSNFIPKKVPEPRPWVGLTDEEVIGLQEFAYDDDLQFVRHIEALLKEKNS